MTFSTPSVRNLLGVVAFVLAAMIAAPAPSSQGTLAPDWVDDVLDVVEKVEESLEKAKAVIDQHGPTLPPAQKDNLERHLDTALTSIDQLMDPSTYPSLMPGAGSIDTTIDPATLSDYAGDALDLAIGAVDEVAGGSGFDQQDVATRMLTIEHLITRISPHNYKTVAGL